MPRLLPILTALILLAACSPAEKEPEDPRIAEGARIFSRLCSECHPRGGRGDFIRRIPQTLLMRRSEAQLIKWIQGRDMHREMPSFLGLSETELEALAAFLISQRPGG